ncbi:MAG: acetolactate synthase large subunit [Actinomycetaceae bacterium]|nr:acetolactate synthase large subunit [Actinomycetaceae bacterium]
MAKTPASIQADMAAYGQESVKNIREKSTGARSVVRTLEELGVEVVFGLPGGSVIPTYDLLYDSEKIRHVLVRHEQGAGHAAEGYALATGNVGVCIATSGPGATNLVTPILDAQMDSVPLVCITGQVAASAIGTDAFQEADIVSATMPMAKHSFLCTKAEEIPTRIAEAFYIASTGRPGPVVVDISSSAQKEEADFVWPPRIDLPGYRPVIHPNARQIREAARLIVSAQRPVFYVGGGAMRSNAHDEILELTELTNIPVVTTMTARGIIPDSHPHNMGMPGMHGEVSAVTALQRSDLIIALGARFDDRVTMNLDTFAPDAKVIHVDIDPAEISKNRTADVPIVGDVREASLMLLDAIREGYEKYDAVDLTPWWDRLRSLREKYPLAWENTSDGLLAPQYVIERLANIVGSDDAVYVTGVGQHQMWATHFLKLEHPRQWLSSGGAGTMGFGVPAAMGAQVGQPDSTVWLIDGDGSFQMTNQELATCALNGINIKVALINNSSLGMVRQWQKLFYDERYSHTDLNDGANTQRIPDFVRLSEAYGCHAIRVEKAEDVDGAIKEAMEINDHPVVVEFVVSPDALVWPMVPGGASADDIMYNATQTLENDSDFMGE